MNPLLKQIYMRTHDDSYYPKVKAPKEYSSAKEIEEAI